MSKTGKILLDTISIFFFNRYLFDLNHVVAMITNRYSKLLSTPSLGVCETPKTYTFLTERHLQAIWLEGKYFKELKTADGKKIKILSPGIWNSEAGPDFLKAHLVINGTEVRGDVEIHLSDEGWKSHGHHSDSRYNNVVFHLSQWLPKNPTQLLREDGNTFEQAYLEPYLTIPPARIARLIDLNLYPYKKFIGSGQCAKQLFRSLPEEKIITLFKDASFWRLSQKRMWLIENIQTSHLLFAGGLAAALGYKKNTKAFLDLFLWLAQEGDLTESEMLSAAMGRVGFFTKYYQKQWSSNLLYKELQDLHENSGLSHLAPIPLNLDRIRPYNHPVRRIVYLIKFLNSHELTLLYPQLFGVWKIHWKEIFERKGITVFKERLLETIPTFADTYWNTHYLFETREKEALIPLVGNTFKSNVLINTLLPLFHGERSISEDPNQLNALRILLSKLKVPQTSKSCYLVHRFFGDTPKGSLLSSGETEQGAYQLHTDFCLHHEASCEGCPFVDRYKTAYSNKLELIY